MQKMKILFYAWGKNDQSLDGLTEACRNYEDINSDVQIEIQYENIFKLEDKEDYRKEIGNEFDLIAMVSSDYFYFCRAGYLADLGPYVSVTNRDLFIDSVLDIMKFDGKLMALPTFSGVFGVVYNKNWFAEAGINPPAPGWSWKFECNMAWFVETNVSGVEIISSPSFQPLCIFNVITARFSPAVAEFTKNALEKFAYSFHFSSNAIVL